MSTDSFERVKTVVSVEGCNRAQASAVRSIINDLDPDGWVKPFEKPCELKCVSPGVYELMTNADECELICSEIQCAHERWITIDFEDAPITVVRGGEVVLGSRFIK